MKTENDNEDMFNLSKGLDNFVQVKLDLKSLGVLDAKTTKVLFANFLGVTGPRALPCGVNTD